MNDKDVELEKRLEKFFLRYYMIAVLKGAETLDV